jgi:cytoskeletal protein RodZ
MYRWIWRKLPFNFWGKLTSSVALAGVSVALLWYVVFPWATPLLPFDDVQVGADTQQGPAQEDPNVVDPNADTGPNGGSNEIPYSTVSNEPDPTSTKTPTSHKTSSSVVLPGG